ncbi:MAG: ABC transporter permease [Oscillospiraceae bacterium]|nr:ABC transporter permease [Oscillospiraceae bacterium]
MLRFAIKRTLQLIPLIILLSMVTFIVINLPPGDFLSTYVNNLRSSGVIVLDEEIKELEARYGLGQPIYVQYFRWIGNVLQGNLGYSFSWNRPVNDLIAERLGNTIILSITSLILIWLVAFPLGYYSATHQYSTSDYVFTSISFLGMSIPNFLLAIVFMWVYFLASGKFLSGMFAIEFTGQPMSWAKFASILQHMWMPYLIIVITGTAGLFKTFRANLLDELGKPYVQAARAKGVPNRRLLIKYPVRIALIPFISTVGWMLPGLISGQTLLAIVMGLPTLAPLLQSSLRSQDMFLAGSILLVLCILTVIGTVISDVLLALTDPRIRDAIGKG